MEPGSKLNILFVASEVDPLVKVGGLGDVAGSLPAFLRQIPASVGLPELDVRLAIPFHPSIRHKVTDARLVAEFVVPHPSGPLPAQAYLMEVKGVPVYLISGAYIPEEGPVYSTDHRVDALKYVFFSLAVLELPKALNWPIDILHANDWHTALSPYVLSLRKKQDPFYQSTGSILSVHNLPFMGAGAEKVVGEFGIPPARDPNMPVWSWQIPLPMGLKAADKIVAVSPTYAEEILTPEFGCDLQDFLKTRRNALSGILNGLDTKNWDPQTDAEIPARFSVDDLPARATNKLALQAEFKLASDVDVPLLILIGRFDRQKGVDIALNGLKLVKDLPWQIIMLGTGDPLLEESAHRMEAELPGKVRAALRYDAFLARRMYAGGDILLMPSRYEPCGLAQMIAMRYGCLPMARATGGLRDTITDNPTGKTSTGFLFATASPEAFAKSLVRALEQYKNHETWQAMQLRAMLQDFSWQKSAIDYAKIYLEIKEETQ
jgi:starch synthase